MHWLRILTRLGLGACPADDTGMGKTVQVIAKLLHLKKETEAVRKPSLLAVPASLIANRSTEIERFAPSLLTIVAHPSEGVTEAGGVGTIATW